MSNLTFNSNSDSTNLTVPKLCDDGSNWSDYKPHIQKAMGSKGLWRHIQGTAIAPKLYTMVNRIPILPDGKTEAMEEQVRRRRPASLNLTSENILLNTSSSVATVATDVFQINWFSVRNKIGKIAKIFVKTEDPKNRGVI